MAFDADQVVEVERKGVFKSIRFQELIVGDSYSISGECWFVETKLESFPSLEPQTAFRCRGKWYLKMNAGDIVRPLIGNRPFGRVDMNTPELIMGDPMVGRLVLSRIE